MKKIELTAEEIRMLEIQMWANPCEAGCPLDHTPRLPKTTNGCGDCNATKNDKYICPLKRAMESIEFKLKGGDKK